MPLDNTDIKALYKMFIDESFTHLTALQEKTQMEDEYYAQTISSAITSAINGSIKTLEVYKTNELKDKQILDVISSTLIKELQSAKDLLIKDQQELGERLKNGGVHYIYTYYVDGDAEVVAETAEIGDVKTKVLASGDGKSIIEYQTDKLDAETSFIKEQELQLGYSVTYNNRIKVLQDYSGMLGDIGLGGFVIPSDMWTTYFNLANDIYVNYGDVPVEKAVTLPASVAIVKA